MATRPVIADAGVVSGGGVGTVTGMGAGGGLHELSTNTTRVSTPATTAISTLSNHIALESDLWHYCLSGKQYLSSVQKENAVTRLPHNAPDVSRRLWAWLSGQLSRHVSGTWFCGAEFAKM